MAKKTNIRNEKPSFFARAKMFLANPNVLFMTGLLFGALAIFLCSSFLSFFSSGGADQSIIDAVAAGADVAGEVADNASGKGGAFVADFLVNGCFGWSSVLVVPLLVVIMLRLMNIRRPDLLKWFIATVFGVVWGSVFFAFILGSLFAGSFMSPGGAHGENVAAWLSDKIGVVGLVLVLALTLIAFMTYLTRETLVWLQKIFSFSFIPSKTEDEADGGNAAGSEEPVVAAVADDGEEPAEDEMPLSIEYEPDPEDEQPAGDELAEEIDEDDIDEVVEEEKRRKRRLCLLSKRLPPMMLLRSSMLFRVLAVLQPTVILKWR